MIDDATLVQRNKLTALKFSLLAEGLQLTKSATEHLVPYKHPIRTRSGSSGGLDIILPLDVYVNVPIYENFVSKSPYYLDYANDTFFITHDYKLVERVTLLPTPNYYNLKTKDGTENMSRIGQMCSADRFCYGMTGPGCYFWPTKKRCQFCSIGKNYDADASRKKAQHLLEVLEAAINDPHFPAKHILLGGGTPPGEDMGAKLAADLCLQIKKRFDISVYVMIAAPLNNTYIDMLYDNGVDELGMNLEFWSEEAWKTYIPGKNKEIGKKKYLEALDHALKLFGPINTRTIFIVGLERKEYTVEGAINVASKGIMPILSPFRPLNGTMLQSGSGFDGATYLGIYSEIENNIKKYNIPVGPTCICCQNNTLAMPFGTHYRSY